MKKKTVVSMTSIPPRFAHLPERLRILEKQTQKPDLVQINIPTSYRRFEGEIPSLPELPSWAEVHFCDIDYGPATKLLPTLSRMQGQNYDILICDDDRSHDKNWVERLCSARGSRPLDIISERGWNIAERFELHREYSDLPRAKPNNNGGANLPYRLKRILSLNLYRPKRALFKSAGYVDIFEGFLGALIPVAVFPDVMFTPPEHVWAVDDVWISGMAYKAGIKVWTHEIPRPVSSNGFWDKRDALSNMKINNLSRDDLDYLAVDLLRKEFQVWI